MWGVLSCAVLGDRNNHVEARTGDVTGLHINTTIRDLRSTDMSRTKREKNPDMLCGFQWGGTANLRPDDSGWKCAHSCRLRYQHETPIHFCCSVVGGSIDV